MSCDFDFQFFGIHQPETSFYNWKQMMREEAERQRVEKLSKAERLRHRFALKRISLAGQHSPITVLNLEAQLWDEVRLSRGQERALDLFGFPVVVDNQSPQPSIWLHRAVRFWEDYHRPRPVVKLSLKGLEEMCDSLAFVDEAYQRWRDEFVVGRFPDIDLPPGRFGK